MASCIDFEKLWESYQFRKKVFSEIFASSYIAKVRGLFMLTSSGGIGTVLARDL